jgi:hypothetical protein
MVPEAALEQTEAGLAPVGEGWVVLNAREALAVGAREHSGDACNGGAYTVDEVALRRGAGVEEKRATPEPTRYRDGSLPGGD